jgi:hypothetical protein
MWHFRNECVFFSSNIFNVEGRDETNCILNVTHYNIFNFYDDALIDIFLHKIMLFPNLAPKSTVEAVFQHCSEPF